ncbi:MAG: hypothetical protein JXA38_00145 [Methanosarcinaceae archaeon]|nr:hypothetical protein [Methanosarcinaceae archaeon]
MISGCGFACDECILLKENICSGCSPDIELARECEIMMCLEENQLDNCLHCRPRLSCEKYTRALKNCPLRVSIVGH